MNNEDLVHLYLDDMRRCPKGFALARTGEECIMLLRECKVDILSLDYELGFESKMCGRDVVMAIILEKLYPREVYLHTSSMFGKREMYQLLYEHKPADMILHNGPMSDETLHRIAKAVDQA
ncbi:cyclic-phosphate processing receiver domain-containing protein [Paenibacillus crassostreae]|uniref:Cell division protein FtsJ n=2 Tax=Paenibacillus crassostreae TaxID=1763538 RepID=A0A167DS95_9BACL|nr:cyclic-phosphate processing receiver domain-containing protein [Paenibacillus crassostreae]AOZ91116.1 cell division protein FtsJ [Paenibacillus crassostreae]OAB74724.1 cell division protein FtsJ [Paenibacillus crassostreae]